MTNHGPNTIDSPDSPALDRLCQRLADEADRLDLTESWPAAQLKWCGDAGVWRWFLPSEWGGFDWSDVDLARGYLKLSAACLTTTFIITQGSGACRRIAASPHHAIKARLLPDLATGETFATIGISHLTTSHRHLGRPVLTARRSANGFTFDGFSPWVTGGRHADTIVIGATLDDGRQMLVALPTHLAGVTVESPVPLIGLTASATGRVVLDEVELTDEYLLAGPSENVMAEGGGQTGGLQTSALAIGLADASVALIDDEARQRPDLTSVASGLREEAGRLTEDLLNLAAGRSDCTPDDLRARANCLALRASQAALAAAKGRGYVRGQRAGRLCREALFFLVWSCPQSVVRANLCELAGLGD